MSEVVASQNTKLGTRSVVKGINMLTHSTSEPTLLKSLKMLRQLTQYHYKTYLPPSPKPTVT